MKSSARRSEHHVLSGKLFVCKVEGNGFVVLNKHGHWTPILDFAHPYEANLATHLARWRHGYTTETVAPPCALPVTPEPQFFGK